MWLENSVEDMKCQWEFDSNSPGDLVTVLEDGFGAGYTGVFSFSDVFAPTPVQDFIRELCQTILRQLQFPR